MPDGPSIRWQVSYADRAGQPLVWVADEDAPTAEEVMRMVRDDYTPQETPDGLYRVRCAEAEHAHGDLLFVKRSEDPDDWTPATTEVVS